jgi:hypothetical protein
VDDRVRKNEIWHLGERGELNTGIFRETLRERDHLEDPNVDGRIILKWLFNK